MHYERRYLQYNELVFAEVVSTEYGEYDASWKTYDTDYGFSHGSYAPQKRLGGILRSGSVDLTLTFDLKKLPCEQRPFFIRFAKSQLTTQGKLWAIEDNTLIWAYAYITSYSSSVDVRKDTFEVDVSFDIPEGYWHKADKQKTFIVPWDVCDFMECLNYKDIHPCKATNEDCCNCSKKTPVVLEDCDCCCDMPDKEQALCYFTDYQAFYDKCGVPFKIVYDCNAAEKYFSNFLSDERMGQKFCGTCGQMAVGILYSDTDIPTEDVTITLHGQMVDPYIEINGNGNIIKGEYNGVLEIHPDGSVYSYTDGCGSCDPLPTSVWVVPEGMNYGWTVKQGNNRVIIDAGCCTYCAYISVGSLTI